MYILPIIEDKIRAAFNPTILKLIDESSKHKGHHYYKEGAVTHLKIIISLVSFPGLTKVQIHQKIYKCLEEEMSKDLHAVSIELI